jgi:hypothetical protein
MKTTAMKRIAIITLVIFVIIAVLLLVTCKKKSEYSGQDPLPKTIWLLWLQGWDNAPWVPKQVAKSWEKLNPGWEIKLIDRETCPVEIYGDTPQAQSDVIRLELLSKYGGVWADSTMLCMQPLDDWVHEAVEPAGIWMYRGRLPACTGPASWFIVAKPGNMMSTKWVEACREYWKGRANNDAYPWMDNLWFKIYEDDQEFKDEWAKVPYLCCEGDEQSHMLAGRVGEDNQDLKNTLKTKPPRAVKLDHRAIDEKSINSNGYYAIQCALNA